MATKFDPDVCSKALEVLLEKIGPKTYDDMIKAIYSYLKAKDLIDGGFNDQRNIKKSFEIYENKFAFRRIYKNSMIINLIFYYILCQIKENFTDKFVSTNVYYLLVAEILNLPTNNEHIEFLKKNAWIGFSHLPNKWGNKKIYIHISELQFINNKEVSLNTYLEKNLIGNYEILIANNGKIIFVNINIRAQKRLISIQLKKPIKGIHLEGCYLSSQITKKIEGKVSCGIIYFLPSIAPLSDEVRTEGVIDDFLLSAELPAMIKRQRKILDNLKSNTRITI